MSGCGSFSSLRARRLAIPVTMCVAVALAGCGGQSHAPQTPADANAGTAAGTTGDSDTDAPAQPAKIAKVDASKLPIGSYLPWLDGDRVRVAIPTDWRTLPRDSDYLVRFYHTDRNGLPRINISVEDAAYGSITSATVENIQEFAKSYADRVRSGGTARDVTVYPMVIGDQPCASYVTQVGLKLSPDKTIRADRQRLLVLRDARLYTIDLLTLPGRVSPSRPAAYAVCSSLDFDGEESGDATPSLGESNSLEPGPE